MDWMFVLIVAVFAVPTYFLVRLLIGKSIVDLRKRKIAVWITTICATPLAIIGTIWFVVWCVSYHPTRDFDRMRWKNDDRHRYELSENLIDSKLLVGKTKQQVIFILGEEDNPIASNEWEYDLGLKPSILAFDNDIFGDRIRQWKSGSREPAYELNVRKAIDEDIHFNNFGRFSYRNCIYVVAVGRLVP
ncbi:MAG: hypothetical protein EOO50_07405 [Flavobacterium sp.]|uniref:hypothetical protein n=1 Tax=Flavobacterium sp. TaxID=239 RepID=UPI0011F4C8F3|nr:hypothetical protein [Flavobacterium sp.]RZJ67081.1 MAG: hypothetical protein EOO50_07405 [Flavobacterium sp.]